MTASNLKDIIKEELCSIISESGLSRVHKHIIGHDCSIITAYRNNAFDRSLCVGQDFSEEELEMFDNNPRKANLINNRNLKAYLLHKGYGVTSVDGSYVENFKQPDAVEVKEDSLFVVNLNDDPDFFDKMQMLGRKYCQDSVLLIPVGGENAYYMGTNKTSYPGLGNRLDIGGLKMGEEAEFMTRVRNRPFFFSESLETYNRLPRLQRQVVATIATRLF